MAPSTKFNFSKAKQVVRNDFTPLQPPAWKTPIFKPTILTFALIATTMINASAISTMQLDGATDAPCESYSMVVDDCRHVSFDDIVKNGCMSYMQSSGEICVGYDDTKRLCVVNVDCVVVDTSYLQTAYTEESRHEINRRRIVSPSYTYVTVTKAHPQDAWVSSFCPSGTTYSRHACGTTTWEGTGQVQWGPYDTNQYLQSKANSHCNCCCECNSIRVECYYSTGVPTWRPTRRPTMRPTDPCVDIYDYCSILAANGLCYHDVETQNSCALSCGTCFNTTIGPSVKPSTLPPTAPTHTPTQIPPTSTPTATPSTVAPSEVPTIGPSLKPSVLPTSVPTTYTPTQSPPTANPTANPSTVAPSKGPTVSPTDSPSRRPSSSPTCDDFLDYCKLISSACNSTHAATMMHMSQKCASTCGFCSPAPTEAPTLECINRYEYCEHGALAGGCYAQDYEARMSFLYDCPVSCGTCAGETLIPTYVPTTKPTSEPTVVPTVKPSLNPSKQPTDYPTSGPTGAPTCQDLLAYCDFVKFSCNSVDLSVQEKLQNECALTCDVCTSQPTTSPSAPCVDSYSYCTYLAMTGACVNSNHEARMDFQMDCPVSCNTCYGKTTSPTRQPTIFPTVSPSFLPTLSPVCLDMIGYCYLLNEFCNSNESSILAKMQEDCPYTCGFCSGGSAEHAAIVGGLNYTKEPTVQRTRAPQSVTRRVVSVKQSPFSTELPIVLGIMLSITLLACLFRWVLAKRKNSLFLNTDVPCA